MLSAVNCLPRFAMVQRQYTPVPPSFGRYYYALKFGLTADQFTRSNPVLGKRGEINDTTPIAELRSQGFTHDFGALSGSLSHGEELLAYAQRLVPRGAPSKKVPAERVRLAEHLLLMGVKAREKGLSQLKLDATTAPQYQQALRFHTQLAELYDAHSRSEQRPSTFTVHATRAEELYQALKAADLLKLSPLEEVRVLTVSGKMLYEAYDYEAARGHFVEALTLVGDKPEHATHPASLEPLRGLQDLAGVEGNDSLVITLGKTIQLLAA